MTRAEMDELILEDDTIPLTSIQRSLAESSSMPHYKKIVDADPDVKRNLRENKNKKIVASVSASSTITHSVPMSRQPTREQNSRVGIPEVDVLGGRGSPTSSNGDSSTGGSPLTIPFGGDPATRRMSALQMLQQQVSCSPNWSERSD